MAQTSKARVVIHADGAVRIHVAPEVMFNLEQSTAVLKNVLGRLGHPGCTSGFQISFQLEEGELSA
jgi:hypothetical protein